MATKQTVFRFLSFFSCILLSSSYMDDDFDVASDSTLTVEHTFDTGADPLYTKRGTINIQSIKSGNAEFQSEEPISPDHLDKLRGLSNNGGVYRIRVSSKAPDGVTRAVTGFIKACALLESNLVNTITIHVDVIGNVLGASVTTSVPYCLGGPVQHQLIDDFHTTIDVIQTLPGPQPETQSYIEKMERDRADKAEGQQPDNRSFFGKYWMYIVPVVIIMMLANSADPNAGGGAR